jgi:hypothetical protein
LAVVVAFMVSNANHKEGGTEVARKRSETMMDPERDSLTNWRRPNS